MTGWLDWDIKLRDVSYVMTASPGLLAAVLVYDDGFQAPPLHSYPGSTSHAKNFNTKWENACQPNFRLSYKIALHCHTSKYIYIYLIPIM